MNHIKPTTDHRLPEVYMVLKDRKQLAKLMVIQEVSARTLAKAAGWRSHTYMNRLLAGEVRTLKPEAATRIALRLGVGVDDLFVARISNDAGHTVQRRAS